MTKKEQYFNAVLMLTVNDFKYEDFVNLYKYARRWFIEDKDYSSPMGKIYQAADRTTFYYTTNYLKENKVGPFKDYNDYSIRQANKLTNLKQLCKFMQRIKNDDIFKEAVTVWLARIKECLKITLETKSKNYSVS